MSYTPTTWATGDVITAEKLNNMESGIVGAGSVFLIPTELDSSTGNLAFTKTFGEIKSALAYGCLIVVAINVDESKHQVIPQSIIMGSDSGGTVVLNDPQTQGEFFPFVATTDNDYPTVAE